jgi:hypothetical protein
MREYQRFLAGQRDGEDSIRARASGNGEEIRRHLCCARLRGIGTGYSVGWLFALHLLPRMEANGLGYLCAASW